MKLLLFWPELISENSAINIILKAKIAIKAAKILINTDFPTRFFVLTPAHLILSGPGYF